MWLTTLGLIDFHLTPCCPSIEGRATPQSKNGQLAFLRIGRVCALEHHTGDAGVSKPRITEVDDQPKRQVHQFHVRKTLRLVARHVHLVFVKRVRVARIPSVVSRIGKRPFIACRVSDLRSSLILSPTLEHYQSFSNWDFVPDPEKRRFGGFFLQLQTHL